MSLYGTDRLITCLSIVSSNWNLKVTSHKYHASARKINLILITFHNRFPGPDPSILLCPNRSPRQGPTVTLIHSELVQPINSPRLNFSAFLETSGTQASSISSAEPCAWAGKVPFVASYNHLLRHLSLRERYIPTSTKRAWFFTISRPQEPFCFPKSTF